MSYNSGIIRLEVSSQIRDRVLVNGNFNVFRDVDVFLWMPLETIHNTIHTNIILSMRLKTLRNG